MNGPYVAFDTELFRKDQPDDEIDQWFLGEDLATWLHDRLIENENVTSGCTPVEEDWAGWTFGVRVSGVWFWVNIWNVRTWIVGLEAKPGLFGMFRKARAATSVNALRRIIDQVLVAADFTHVAWYDHWPDERCG